MTATCSREAVIQIFLGLIKGETTSQYRVNTTVIKSVIENDVLTGLIMDATTIFTREVWLDSLSLEINENISIPSIIRTDKKKMDLSGRESFATFSVSAEGRSHISLAKTRDFFDLACSNSKSNYWRITIHLEYFSP
jgi:hypothetical protein